MSQYDFGNLESPLSGTSFFNTHLEPWRNALHSNHAGSSRPSYAVASMTWVNTTTNPHVLNYFDGSQDIPLGYIDISTNSFIPAGLLLNNTAATTNPTVNDDSADGYAVGSKWVNVTGDLVFECVDSSVGAAIWKQMVDTNSTQTLSGKTLTSPTINGGTMTGMTDIAVADGGTGASTAAAARTNLSAAGLTQTGFFSFTIESPKAQDYKLIQKIPIAVTITETTTILAGGTATVTPKINTTAIGGGAHSATTSENSITRSTSNAMSVGDDLVATVASPSSADRLTIAGTFTYTLSA